MPRSIVRTWRDRITGKLTNRITIRVEHRLNLQEMVDGLCSALVRNVPVDELTYPEMRSAALILEDIRHEYETRGTDAVWTWSEMTCADVDECQAWARRLIIGAFPDMVENE